MSQPHFTFVLSTEKKRNCLIKLFNSGICHFHYLKSILNDDSFKEYIKPMVSINLKIYAIIKTVYSCNWLPWTSTKGSHWEVLLEINQNLKILKLYTTWVNWKNQCTSTTRKHVLYRISISTFCWHIC